MREKLDLQVWKENQGAQEFEVFVYLERKILDFKYELEDEYVSSGGVRYRTKSII